MSRGAKIPTVRRWVALCAEPAGAIETTRVVRDDPGSVWIVVGGERVGLLSCEDAVRLGVRAGVRIDAAFVDRIGSDVRRALCVRTAVRLLARRERSVGGLVRDLTARGHARADAEACARTMRDRGLVDDERYADGAVRRELARRPAGGRLLEAKLRAGGVDPGIARRTVERAIAGRDEYGDALLLARKGVRAGRRLERDVLRRRLIGRLGRRGFGGEVARRAIDDAIREGAPA